MAELGPHFLADGKHRRRIQEQARVGCSLKDLPPVTSNWTYFLSLTPSQAYCHIINPSRDESID